MNYLKLKHFILYFAVSVSIIFPEKNFAQQTVELNLESAVDIALNNSYQVRQLQLGIERTRKWLEAQRADLKSRLYLNLTAPDIKQISDYKWNSTIERDVLVRQNTRRWQANLALRQPVVLFGYPTNGYLSLNNQMYRYTQIGDAETDESNITYYNRYFLKFEQPFFQPNRLKNDLEDASLDLEYRELQYLQDLVQIIHRVSDDYYDLFRMGYRSQIFRHSLDNLEELSEIANQLSEQDTSRNIEAIQVQVELANMQERMSQNQSDYRIQASRLKQRLRLDESDSLAIAPEINLQKISVNEEAAVDYGYSLRPRLRLQEINKRRNEIDLDNTTGWNAFRVNLEMTYGLEKQDPDYANLWQDQDNSYSMGLNAYVPLVDWGQRKARIEAQEIGIEISELHIEESETLIKSEIRNSIANLEEYQDRAMNMRENMRMAMEISTISLDQYADGRISLQDILQTISRQRETELNFLDAYLGYRRSLIRLMGNTYYDFENGRPLVKMFDEQLN